MVVSDVAVIVVLWGILVYLLRKTKVWLIYIGTGFLYIVSQFVKEVGLSGTAQMVQIGVWVVLIGSVVLFQHELRVVLRQKGWIGSGRKEPIMMQDSIVQAVFSLSSKKTGALIVLDHKKTIPFVTEDRVKIDASISSSLLETLFYHGTPLHDGAVIVQGKRIIYAGCKLPLSGKRRDGSERLGTRHMAAVENSERYEVSILVVSEETGRISIAKQGVLHPIYTKEELLQHLSEKK